MDEGSAPSAWSVTMVRMRSTLLAEMPERVLLGAFGVQAVIRGRTYAAEGRVLEMAVVEDQPGYLVLEGLVEGQGEDYDTSVTVIRDRSRWSVGSDCSCPVADRCKHGVAMLVTALGTGGRRLEPQEVSPTARLDELLSGLEGGPADAPRKPLALQVEIGRPGGLSGRYGAPAPGPTVLVRPLRRGAKARWIKTGATWSDASGWARAGEHDPRQAAALAEMARMRDSLHVYSLPGDGLDLSGFGPGVWSVLREAVDAGATLVPVAPLDQVSLAASGQHAEVEVDVTAAPDGSHRVTAVLRLGPTPDERRWHGSDVVVLGGRGHGVGLVTPESAGHGRHLLLVPLARPLDPGVRRLVGAEEPLVVPAGAATEVLEDYLPRLRRHLPVASSDGSVEVPQPQPPTLRLRVGWQSLGQVSLAWEWCYRLGRQEDVYPLDSDQPRAQRSAAAEEEQLAGLDLAPPVRALLCAADGRLHPRPEPTGTQLAALVADVLPALRAHPSVEVVEEGEPIDYRPSQGEPAIRFEVVADDDGSEAAESVSTPTDWLDLQVVITVDGESVPLPEVLAALTREAPVLVLPSGLLVPTDHPALLRLGEAVRAAAELSEQQAGQVRVGTGDLGVWSELAELGVVDEQAQQWVRAAQALAGYSGLPEVDPTGVVSRLRPYQLDGFRWLAFLWRSGLGGILADDMGLGKTLQALCLISHARAEGADPFLVVAPTSVVGAWVQEVARHTPGLVVRAVTSSQRRRGTTILEEAEGADVVVTSYTLLRLEAEQYAARPWGGLVLDEAQQVKNHRGKTYRAVRGVDASFRLALTGTPFENRLLELWSLLSIVAPGLYPSPGGFVEHVANPVERRGDAQALERFRRRIRPFLLRRTKEVVAADLPAKQEQVLEVVLGPQHRRLYDVHLQRERQAILGLLDDFAENRVAIFAALTRLRQLSLDVALVDPAYDDVGSAKLDVLVEHLHELVAEGHRALVFSQFTGFLSRVSARLAAERIETAYLDGRTRDRPAAIAAFKDGTAPVFLISLKAGGVGLTLTEADYVFVLDPWWNPAAEAQAVDRAHRIGQTRPVMVYRLVATETIEEKVMALKARKAALFAQVLAGDGALAQALTAEDVRAMLTS